MNKRKYLRKIGISLLVMILSISFICLFDIFPASSAEMAFRRKEKQNLIGPAQIFATLDFLNSPYDHILIGKSAYGYTFFEYRDNALDDGKLTYVPKQEGATLYCTYEMYGSEEFTADWLPIFVFTDQSAAVSAKLTLSTTQHGETVTYPLEAKKRTEGYFLFSWNTLELRAYDFSLIQQMIAGQHKNHSLAGTAEATLELYDSKGTLLESYLFTK